MADQWYKVTPKPGWEAHHAQHYNGPDCDICYTTTKDLSVGASFQHHVMVPIEDDEMVVRMLDGQMEERSWMTKRSSGS